MAPPFRQNLAGANLATGTMQGAHGGTQQLGPAAAARAALMQRANGLTVGGGAGQFPGIVPPMPFAPMPPAPGSAQPNAVQDVMPPGPTEIAALRREFQPPTSGTGELPTRGPYRTTTPPVAIDNFSNPDASSVADAFPGMPLTAEMQPPGPASPQVSAPLPPSVGGVALPTAAGKPAAPSDPGMSAFQQVMQSRAQKPAQMPMKPVGQRRGPANLSQVYRRPGLQGKPQTGGEGAPTIPPTRPLPGGGMPRGRMDPRQRY